MEAFTDYPIRDLGDSPNEIAPIREVEVLSYDGNKYCMILVDGVTTEVKSGYLYHGVGRAGEVPCFMHDELGDLPITQDYKTLLQIIQGMKGSQLRSYHRLKKKYDSAEWNRKNNPDKFGGEDYIRGYMNGITDGMVQFDPNLKSVCMDKRE